MIGNVMERLNAREIAELWCIWETEIGESFMDFCGEDYVFKNVSFLLGYWSVKFPDLYTFLMKVSGGEVPWKYPQDGLIERVEEYYNYQWCNDNADETYLQSIMPWCTLIADNNYYFERFSNWMLEECDDGTSPYSICEKEFEEWRSLNSTKSGVK